LQWNYGAALIKHNDKGTTYEFHLIFSRKLRLTINTALFSGIGWFLEVDKDIILS
jgi:hypothetical protein